MCQAVLPNPRDRVGDADRTGISQRVACLQAAESSTGDARADRGEVNVELSVHGQIEALHLEPGDVVVVTVENRISANEAVHLRDLLNGLFPDHRVVLFASGITLQAVRP
jgi:hypothetical protein